MNDRHIVKTSMLYWWPKIKNLPTPTPTTEIVEVPYEYLIGMLDGKRLPSKYRIKLAKAGRRIGYPLFLRTDMSSAKHQWERTCCVPDESNLLRHIWSLIDNTLASGMFGELDPNALVFRELLPLNSLFTAFNGLPISAERRYFVRDSVVECHHPYWTTEALIRSWKTPSSPDWERQLDALNKESEEEISLLTKYAEKAGQKLGGYWSIDFAESRSNAWYLIDMAEGEKSWHPQHQINTPA